MGLKQSEVGQLIGVHQSQITHLETGNRYPSFEALAGLEALYGVSPKKLFPRRHAAVRGQLVSKLEKLIKSVRKQKERKGRAFTLEKLVAAKQRLEAENRGNA